MSPIRSRLLEGRAPHRLFKMRVAYREQRDVAIFEPTLRRLVFALKIN
jgi:hypothetical protein